ncbi:hypothetical protein IQ07DRAFT_89363 [Pyrenochaeta sp. DS3sAY3a]|nr:hypothetical protein IQ07DRAFT_89363 [Pyrenochaeta sp. DS3sAY3a]
MGKVPRPASRQFRHRVAALDEEPAHVTPCSPTRPDSCWCWCWCYMRPASPTAQCCHVLCCHSSASRLGRGCRLTTNSPNGSGATVDTAPSATPSSQNVNCITPLAAQLPGRSIGALQIPPLAQATCCPPTSVPTEPFISASGSGPVKRVETGNQAGCASVPHGLLVRADDIQ